MHLNNKHMMQTDSEFGLKSLKCKFTHALFPKFTTGFWQIHSMYTNKLLRRFRWIPVLYMREVTTFCSESRFVSHNRESTQFLGRGSVNREANYRLHLKTRCQKRVVTGWTWLSVHNVSVIKTNTVEGGNVFPKAH